MSFEPRERVIRGQTIRGRISTIRPFVVFGGGNKKTIAHRHSLCRSLLINSSDYTIALYLGYYH